MSRRVIWGATLGLVVTTVAAAVERPGAGDPQPPTGTGEGGRWDRGVASAMHAPPTWRGSRASGVFAGQRVVGIHASTDPLAVAAELGLSVDAIDRNHNIALFSGHEHHLDALQNHEHVVSVHANGRIQAAGVGGRVGPVMGEQRAWHRSGANVPDAVDGLSDVIVAVLDTGVAYRTWCGDAPCAADATPTHQPVPGLDGVAIVAPMDFVDGDAVPLDEHQHGTHIASTILSQGAHRGVAAGAALMPVRVLDASGVGSEFDLILGIHHAIDHGANIISIGGTFAADFRPSSLLCDALDAASEASLVVLAPTGNDGLEQVSWPAAAPSVIAVAASAPEPDFHRLQDPWQTTGIARLAPYANASAAVDVVAPGGDLRFDRTGDGLPDGVLAETIAPADPSEIGHWLLAGTSHATAITAGAAARALALGARPKSVAWALQRPARPLRQEGPADGVGGGYLDVARSDDAVVGQSGFLARQPDVQVALELGAEHAEHDRTRPMVRVAVVGDELGSGAPMQVLATITDGTAGMAVQCTTPVGTDACTLFGAWTEDKGSGTSAWSVQVDGVRLSSGIIIRPEMDPA